MTTRDPTPPRWIALEEGTPPELRASELLRAARKPPLPGPAAMSRIEQTLFAPRRSFPWLKLGLLAASLLVSWRVGVAVVARNWPVLRVLTELLAKPRPQPLPRVAQPSKLVARPSPEPVAEALTPPPLVLASGSVTPRRPAPMVAVPPPPVMSPPPAPAPIKGALAREAERLAQAYGQLREGQAVAALETLARYRAENPVPALGAQADAAELQARLALGDQTGALALLERLAPREFAGLTDPDGLQALRGELLVHQGRPAEALAAFDRLTAASGVARERACYGRATALLALGRIDEARAQLTRYLADYPAGRFTAEVRRALGTP